MTSEKIQILSGWSFAHDPVQTEEEILSPDFGGSGFVPVTLPHDWQLDGARDRAMEAGASQGFYPRGGVGWYRYVFDAPDDCTGETVARILFDGVQRFSTVWCNGEKVGGHNYGCVPFCCELKLKPAGNVVIVKVDCTKGGGDRWYSGAGIFRPVCLTFQGPVHIRPWGAELAYDLGDALDTAEVRLTLRTRNTTGRDFRALLRAALVPPDGEPVEFSAEVSVPAGDGECKLGFTLSDVQLWDINSPKLYSAEVSLVGEDGETLDSAAFRTGFRSSRFDGERGYFLNGRNIKLYGANLHSDGGAFGIAAPLKVWRRRLEALKDMGCNAIRCSHNPMAEDFYDLCDEMGFVVIDELYDKWKTMYNQLFHEADRFGDLAAMIHRDFNHPSVILWSTGNELKIQYSEEFYRLLSEICAESRRLDPRRPVSLALISYYDGSDISDPKVMEEHLDMTLRYAEIVDVAMLNYMESFYTSLRERGLKKCVIGSEVFGHYRFFEHSINDAEAVSAFRDVDERPYVAGGFIWAGVDYLGGCIGWPARGCTAAPINSAGIRKLRSWHLQGQWTSPDVRPFVKLGIYDDTLPYDMARDKWGAPPMSERWDYPESEVWRMKHIAVMTNCEEVTLQLGKQRPSVRVKRDERDRMAHFWTGYHRAPLKAVGYLNGKPVAEEVMAPADAPEKLELSTRDTLVADGRDVAFVDIVLTDKNGRAWTFGRPKVKVTVAGAGELFALDNGDFSDTESDYRDASRSLYNGRLCAIVRAGNEAGEVLITAGTDGLPPVSLTIPAVKKQ